MAVDRGEFRGIHVVIMDGPDFQRLSGYARSIWYPTRLATGAAGIAVIPAFEAVTAERAGWSLSDTREAIAELVAQGWLEVERNVVWVVRGLELEPSYSVDNQNHRTAVANYLESLPRLSIVDRFKSRYANWLRGTPLALPVPSGEADATPSGSPPPSHPPGHGGAQKTETETETEDRGSSSAARARDGDGRPYLTRCVVAMNTGIAENPQIPHPREVPTSTQVAKVTWEADGIPVEIAERVILERARAYEPAGQNRQPTSLRYFDAPVREAWEQERAGSTPPRPNGPTAKKRPLAAPRTL